MITVEEKYRSRGGEFGSNSYAEIRLVAIDDTGGTADLDDVQQAVANWLEDNGLTEYQDLPLDGIAPDEIGSGAWDVTARFRSGTTGDAVPVGESRFTFDITTSTQHVTQALSNVSRSPIVPFTIIDFKGAIGVTAEGEVQGVDVDVTEYEWEETWAFEASAITDTYKTTLKNLCRRMNVAPFRNFPAGEVRLRGARGRQRDDGKVEITFRFSQLDNKTGIVVGDITAFNKLGWDYVWIYYREKEVTAGSAKWIVKVPQQANVERVYEFGDYTAIGIG